MQKHSSENTLFGFWLYLMSDVLLFATLFAVYAVLQSATFGGPSVASFFSLSFVLTETLILLTSSLTIGLALLAAHDGKKTYALILLCSTLFLGLVFLGMEVSEFRHLVREGWGPGRSAFLSAFFALVGTHGLHVFFGTLWMLIVIAHIVAKGITGGVLRKLGCLALFWHFLDVIWIFIFTFVYLLGAL